MQGLPGIDMIQKNAWLWLNGILISPTWMQIFRCSALHPGWVSLTTYHYNIAIEYVDGKNMK